MRQWQVGLFIFFLWPCLVSCSSESSRIIDASIIAASVDAVPDAHPLCSVKPLGPSPAQWQADVMWTKAIGGNYTGLGYTPGVRSIAPDETGIDVITNNSLIRTDVDGHVLFEKTFGRRPFMVAKGDGNFAILVFDYDEEQEKNAVKLCIVSRESEFDIEDCKWLTGERAVRPWPFWFDGYYNFTSRDASKNIVVKRFDLDGELHDSQIVLPPLEGNGRTYRLKAAGESLIVYAKNEDSTQPCGSMFAAKVELNETMGILKAALPTHYGTKSAPTFASGPEHSMTLGNAVCAPQDKDHCMGLKETKVGIASFVDSEGNISIHPVPKLISGDHQLIWDGESFVDLVVGNANSVNSHHTLFVYSNDGLLIGQVKLPGPYDDPALHLAAVSSIVALGPRDYLLGYSVGGLSQHHLMRVKISPP